MANPNPQHTPTDGLGVAAIVTLAGTGLAKVGSQVALSAGVTPGGHQYALTLSLSAAGGHAATCQLTTTIVDVLGNTYSPVNSPTYKSYGDPANEAGSPPSWYRPSNFTDGTVSYDPNVASVSSSGLITSRHVGQCIVEVQFPTFDNVQSPETDADTGDPKDMIYSQIIVTVIP